MTFVYRTINVVNLKYRSKKKCRKFLPNLKGQVPNMKSTEPELVPVLEKSPVMQFQEDVELPAIAICENAHPVGRTASTSSFLSKHSVALYAVWASDCSLNFKLVDKSGLKIIFRLWLVMLTG